jgi:hypothetical protein
MEVMKAMIASGYFLRRARRDWTCYSERARHAGWAWADKIPAEHTPRIPRGARYVENLNNAPSYQSGDRYCLACARTFCGWEGGPQ